MSAVQDGVIPAGLVIDYSTDGMKELDALAAEIDLLKRYRCHLICTMSGKWNQ